ncbi:HEAT repeat domain-containing protein, partial [bacterium]|nr:HEAT repeat domain-containing protein [bacterium]
LLAINPDLEVPYRLWEIAELSSQNKTMILKKILASACQVIQDAGMVKDFPGFMNRLQTWVYKRTGPRYVQDCIARFKSYDFSTNPEFEASLSRNLRQPSIRSAFEEALQWPISEDIKNKIRALLGQPLVSPSPQKSELNTKESFAGLSPDRQTMAVSSWGAENIKEAKPILENLLISERPNESVLSAAIQAATRLELRGFNENALKWLKNKDANVVSSALEYLAQFDQEALFPFLGQFLKSPNLRVKTTALKIFKRFDAPQAVKMLVLMLKGDHKQRCMALSCLIHFEFSMFRKDLADFISGNPQRDLLESAICLFQANPDVENLFVLFRLEKNLPAETAKLIEKTRRQTESNLIEMGIILAFLISSHFLKPRQMTKQKKVLHPMPLSFLVLFPGEKPRKQLGKFFNKCLDGGWRSPFRLLSLFLSLNFFRHKARHLKQ